MNRRGVTLIELSVALAIVGLLAAILIPAVLFARESSRRTQCQSNLRQIGVALEQYVSTHQMFPLTSGCRSGPLVALLPYLDQQNLYDKFNWKGGDCEEVTAPVIGRSVPLFLCPSDSAPAVIKGIAATSYLGNAGSGVQKSGYNGILRHSEPYYPNTYRNGPVWLAGKTDGLSNTAAFAEVTHWDNTNARNRVVWETPIPYQKKDELDRFAEVCRSIPPDPPKYGWRGDPWSLGRSWVEGDMATGLYTHVLPPNNPSCSNAGAWQLSAITPSSQHSDGVNVLFADGRVEFISDSVDVATWRELGSWVKDARVHR